MLIELSGRPSGHRLHNVFTPLATGVAMVDRYIDYVEERCIEQSELPAVRSLLIGYFDSEPCLLEKVPDAAEIREQFGNRMLLYECLLKPGKIQEIRDGHTLMERGYYILEGKNRAELMQDRELLLRQVFAGKTIA